MKYAAGILSPVFQNCSVDQILFNLTKLFQLQGHIRKQNTAHCSQYEIKGNSRSYWTMWQKRREEKKKEEEMQRENKERQERSVRRKILLMLK